MLSRPNLYVLAGVNGAGKSSVGGAFLNEANLPWYNPDTFARALMVEHGLSPLEAGQSGEGACGLLEHWYLIWCILRTFLDREVPCPIPPMPALL